MRPREPVPERVGRGHRDIGWGRLERDERHHVDDAEPRMDADVLAEVEVLARDVHESPGGRFGAARVRGRDGEDAAVVVVVAVHVEQRAPCAGTDRREPPFRATFGDVDDGLEHAGQRTGAAGSGARRSGRTPSR